MWVDFSLSGAMVTYRAAANHRRGEERIEKGKKRRQKRRGKERGKERKGKERKGKERKGKERGCEGFCRFHKSYI